MVYSELVELQLRRTIGHQPLVEGAAAV